jgi:hypothetical protein
MCRYAYFKNNVINLIVAKLTIFPTNERSGQITYQYGYLTTERPSQSKLQLLIEIATDCTLAMTVHVISCAGKGYGSSGPLYLI